MGWFIIFILALLVLYRIFKDGTTTGCIILFGVGFVIVATLLFAAFLGFGGWS